MAQHSERWYQAVGIKCRECEEEPNRVCRTPGGAIYSSLHQSRWRDSQKPENAAEWSPPGQVK